MSFKQGFKGYFRYLLRFPKMRWEDFNRRRTQNAKACFKSHKFDVAKPVLGKCARSLPYCIFLGRKKRESAVLRALNRERDRISRAVSKQVYISLGAHIQKGLEWSLLIYFGRRAPTCHDWRTVNIAPACFKGVPTSSAQILRINHSPAWITCEERWMLVYYSSKGTDELHVRPGNSFLKSCFIIITIYFKSSWTLYTLKETS